MANKIRKTLILLLIVITITGSASAYYCVHEGEPVEISDFKYKVNRLAFEEEVKRGITEEALNLKLKYFVKCE